MNKVKVFYVCDSYHTGTISDAIKKAFPDAIVYNDSTIFSVCAVDVGITVGNLIQKLETEKAIVKDKVSQKVDFFILSAKLISDGSVVPDELKKAYGTMDSKSIAVSMTSHFLSEAKSHVDLTESKDTFFDAEDIKKFFLKKDSND